MAGFEPGTHVGMPSTDLTVVIPLDAPLQMLTMSTPKQRPGAYGPLASGLGTVPVVMAHNGFQHGIQLALTPLGARALFGMPTSELGLWIVPLVDVLGADCSEIVDRISASTAWADRFAVLDEVFARRLSTAPDASVDPRIMSAWHLLVNTVDARVDAVADRIGWSRKYLGTKFASEFGVTPKDAARLARFGRSHQALRRSTMPPLSTVAAECGYYDQAHMAREWRELAGSAPSIWRANEQFAFVQDAEHDGIRHWTA